MSNPSNAADRKRASRRRFLASSVGMVSASAATAGLGVVSGVSQAEDAATTKDSGPACLDYGLSFLCNTLPNNSVRFWIESRTTVIDEANGITTEFYQCASCKSEDTFAEKDLFYAENYDFLPIFGGEELEDLLVFRRPVQLSDRYRTIAKSKDHWGKPILKLRQGRNIRALNTWDEIRDSTAEAIPVVSQTEIANPKTRLRAIIECPVKTMNISHPKRMYQVDTGPIAFPDLSHRVEPLIDMFSLAFVAFNASHFADFVVEQPTAVTANEKELCKVYHYSNPISLPAKNTLLAVGAAD